MKPYAHYALAWFGWLASLVIFFAFAEVAGLGTASLRRDLFPLLFGAFAALVIHASIERGD